LGSHGERTGGDAQGGPDRPARAARLYGRLLLAQVYELQDKESAILAAYRALRQRERRILTEGLGSRESLVSWRLGGWRTNRIE